MHTLSRYFKTGRFVGFDPNVKSQQDGKLEFRGEYFNAESHLPELGPDIVICRHVLEHLSVPLQFVERFALAAAISGRSFQLYAEVPCVDRAIENNRLADYYFEHNSHFTAESFANMFQRVGAVPNDLHRCYDDEVLAAFVTFPTRPEVMDRCREVEAHRLDAIRAEQQVGKQLRELHASGKRVAIWGGTGKAAAFMQRYGVDRERFPLVVDSDPEKCGTYVPGTAQLIQPVDKLQQEPAETILIPMPWRARDILVEMQQKAIAYEDVLIEHQQRLVNFHTESHIY